MKGEKNNLVLSRRRALVLAAALSIILFGAGLFSGLSVEKAVEQRAQQAEQQASLATQKVGMVEQSTERNLTFLSTYVDSLSSELRSLQLQDDFVRSLDEKRRCDFADVYFSQAADKLNYYWSVLPYRLEQYEQGKSLTPQYAKLKSEYTKLSLEAWMIARDNERKCNTTAVPILYFYSQNCTACVEQGEILDQVKGALSVENRSALIFTIDISQDEPALTLIKKYYAIDSVPAIVVRERSLQGGVENESRILRMVRGST